MTTLLALNTTIRPGGVDYFTDTIAAADAAGAKDHQDKIVYSDGPFDKTCPPGWSLVETAVSLGTLPALRALVAFAKERNSDLLLLEDDLRFTSAAVKTMLEFAVPDDLAFVSFFDFVTPPKHPPGLETRGFVLGKPLQAGVQAVKLPRRTLDFLWNPALPAFISPTPPGGKEFGRLAALKFFCGQLSPWKQFGVHFPHLVQHTGDVSAIHNVSATPGHALGERPRLSNNFAGSPP